MFDEGIGSVQTLSICLFHHMNINMSKNETCDWKRWIRQAAAGRVQEEKMDEDVRLRSDVIGLLCSLDTQFYLSLYFFLLRMQIKLNLCISLPSVKLWRESLSQIFSKTLSGRRN